jgi:hypothetical protein
MVSRHSGIFKTSWPVVIGMRNSGDEAAARDEFAACIKLSSCRRQCRCHYDPIAALRQREDTRFRLARNGTRVAAALDRNMEKTALLVEGFVLFVVRARCPHDLLSAIWYLAHRTDRAREF